MPNSTLEVAPPTVVSHAEWTAARTRFLDREKEFTRLRDELSRERRSLPWEKVDKQYSFGSTAGEVTLADLFDGRNQLVVYHFMLGAGWEQGCPGCSYLADHFDGATLHLAQRDTTLVAVSHAPIEQIQAFKSRMGWKFHWVSSFSSSFNFDYHVSFTPEDLATGKVEYNYGKQPFGSEEAPGASVFFKDATGDIFHTYSTYGRGLDILLGTYNFLDLTPKGRDEDNLKAPMAWVKHHDRYTETYFSNKTSTSAHANSSHSCCTSQTNA